MIQITIRFCANSVGIEDSELKYVYADYFVDPVPLRHLIAGALQPSLENPAITKVMHGSSENIGWLQRDFNLFVVNLWDTLDGAGILGGRRNIHHLLEKYCSIETSKDSKMAKWDARPVPDVVLKYAREDTHYLLFLYDALRCKVQVNAQTRPQAIRLLSMWFQLGRSRTLKVAQTKAEALQRNINPQ